MGCDAHLHLECREPGGPWRGTPDFRVSRDYRMFGRMAAGVRECRGGPNPRGFPADASPEAVASWTLVVSDAEDADDEEGLVSPATAIRYIEKGGCEWWPGEEGKRVTHPDWHTPTWISRKEYERATKGKPKDPGDWPDVRFYWEYVKQVPVWLEENPDVLAALRLVRSHPGLANFMRMLEQRGWETRLIVYFDN